MLLVKDLCHGGEVAGIKCNHDRQPAGHMQALTGGIAFSHDHRAFGITFDHMHQTALFAVFEVHLGPIGMDGLDVLDEAFVIGHRHEQVARLINPQVASRHLFVLQVSMIGRSRFGVLENPIGPFGHGTILRTEFLFLGRFASSGFGSGLFKFLGIDLGAGRHPFDRILPGFVIGDVACRETFEEPAIGSTFLALAISSEEDDARIYLAYADGLREEYPNSAKIFEAMAEEETTHRARLIDMHKKRFGDRIPLIRREHVREYYDRKPAWLARNLPLARIRAEAENMEHQAHLFYLAAAQRSSDADTRKLLGDLAVQEKAHESLARRLTQRHAPEDVAAEENETERKRFILTYVQPGLAGLMDGSVSTLAPIFATAFATQNTTTTFIVGLSASVGAGISMGFTEAAHDDGVLSGRGSPIKRGLASGIMTTIGGLGHALPYLIPHFWTATIIAMIVVFVELWAIAWIQNRYMQTPFLRATFQVVLGGALVFAAGALIGSG